MIRSIVVVSKVGANPAQLQTNIEPVRLQHDMGIAVTSISYGEVYNVHKDNNNIYFSLNNAPPITEGIEDIPTMTRRKMKKLWMIESVVKIPPGVYPTSCSIVKAIVTAVKRKIKTHHRNVLGKSSINLVVEDFSHSFVLELKNISFHVTKVDSPWSIIGVTENIIDQSPEFVNNDYATVMSPSFLYASIVVNSYINDKKSRNLAVIPLSHKQGYSFFEFNNPIYVPIEVHDFSSILLELRDLNGEFVKLAKNSTTIITLHVKSI